MKRYKKTFYFKNNTTFSGETLDKYELDFLENYYFKLKKKGKVIIESDFKNNLETSTYIIDLKDVQCIKIEEINEE